MANIHGMGEFNSGNNRREHLSASQRPDSFSNMGNFPLFSSGIANDDPRSLGFFGTIQSIFCPFFKVRSFIAIISVIDVLMYLITLIHSLSNEGLSKDTKNFLGPNDGTLDTFGAKVNCSNL